MPAKKKMSTLLIGVLAAAALALTACEVEDQNGDLDNGDGFVTTTTFGGATTTLGGTTTAP